jgi:hypothetical protein
MRSADAVHLRARRHRVSLLAAIGIIAFVVAYAAVVSYIGAVDADEAELPAAPEGGVAVTFVGTSMAPDSPSLNARVIVRVDGSLLDGSDALREPIAVLIEPSLDREQVYRAARRPDVRTVTIPMVGNVEDYPFDSYRTQLRVTAWKVDGDGGLLEALPISATSLLRDPGWSGLESSDQGTKGAILTATVARARSTVAVSLMLLTLMVALALVAALVAIWVVSGVMEVQVGVASWLAALLFALVPLRTFLPGAPPVGAWIDVLVFFWVEVIVMSAMLAVVVALLVAARRSDGSAEVHPGTPAPDPPLEGPGSA